MAHAIVEYSANLEEKIDMDGLIAVIHEACLNTGAFPLTGMRTRGARRDLYKIANGIIDANFIHLKAFNLPPQEKLLVISTEGIVQLGEVIAEGYLKNQ